MQQQFLDCEAREALIGGGGRSGKTDAALMRLLKYADVPGYSGVAIRRNYAQMIKADAIMARAIGWWKGKPGVRWDAQAHTFYFNCPGGGVSQIAFGHMESALSHYDYQGSVGQCVILDEGTHWETDVQYLYMFSRQSKPVSGPLSEVPLFMGLTANPGGVGHRWVKARFVDPETRKPTAVWIRANVEDNPSVDEASYRRSLEELDPVTRAQLESGSWDELKPGDFFDQKNFVLIQQPPDNLGFMRRVRFWDFAGTEVSKKNKDPDFTASCLMALALGRIPGEEIYYILDITEDRWDAGALPDMVRLHALEDTTAVSVRWEEEGGSSGKVASERAIKPALMGFDCAGIKSTGSKVVRAKPVAAKVSHRKVFVVENPRTKKFLDQCHRFPAVEHDDMVDAMSGACNWLIEHARGYLKGQAVTSGATRTFDLSGEHARPLDQRGQRVRKIRGPFG